MPKHEDQRQGKGFGCPHCGETWTKDENRSLRDKGDPLCPFCGKRGVTKRKVVEHGRTA